MTAHFAKTNKKSLGYNTAEVDDLVAKARAFFAAQSALSDPNFIRNAQFGLEKGGYEIASVDAALDRLDEAFGLQQARNLVSQSGLFDSRQQQIELKDVLLARANRPQAKTFASTGLFGKGYSKKQVDLLLANFATHLDGGTKMTIPQLREARFKYVSGGYNEAQVDAYLDRAIDYLNLEQAIGSTPQF